MMPTSETEMEASNRLTMALAELQQAVKSADEFGLDIKPKAREEIIKLPQERAIELTLWLLRDGNRELAHNLYGLGEDAQVAKIREYSKREDVVGSIGDGDTEAWIDNRQAAKREGKRR
jgi:hypothetical protein